MIQMPEVYHSATRFRSPFEAHPERSAYPEHEAIRGIIEQAVKDGDVDWFKSPLYHTFADLLPIALDTEEVFISRAERNREKMLPMVRNFDRWLAKHTSVKRVRKAA